MLRTITVITVCFCNGGPAIAREGPRYGAPSLKQNSARALAADRDPYADPAAPYKANRLSSPRAEPILNLPGQATVLTRQVLDDMNARSLKDAIRSTAGVTVGR